MLESLAIRANQPYGGLLVQTSSILLASNSPRRRQLLALGGWEYRIIPADVDETPHTAEDPAAYVKRLAETKARVVSPQTLSEEIIVAADTTVADGREIMGKPEDAQDVRKMLRQLRGRTHQVYTAVVVMEPDTGTIYTDLASTDVPMRQYGDDEIEAYIKTGDPFDKAGSYAIQHPGFKPVDWLSGCYANVVGLPLCHLTRCLKKTGLLPEGDIAAACQSSLAYKCPVYASILKGEL
jgi:MAF protein